MRFRAIFPTDFVKPRGGLERANARASEAPCALICSDNRSWDMDILMLGLTIAFFAISFAYVSACDSL